MTTTIGAKVQLEGEKEFKNSIKEIDTQMKALSSALELTSTKFADQGKSMESLTAKQKDLQAIYDKQSEKVDLLRDRLNKATEAYGQADSRVLNYQTQLNKAETAMEKTRQQMSANEKELNELAESTDKAGKSTQEFAEETSNTQEKTMGLGDTLSAVGQKFGITLPSEISSTLNGFANLNAGTLALGTGLSALVTGLAKVEKKLISITKESATFADDILTTSTVTGIATDTLQEYSYAAELLDVSVDTITGSQTKLIRSMASAQEGTAAQTEAFEKLGVAYANADGTLRDSKNVFWDAIDALGQMSNETERDAVAMELFGRSARDLNPLVVAGREAMESFAQEAHDVGYVLDNEALSALGGVDDAFQRFTKTIDAAKNKLSVQFAPSMTTATENMTKFITQLGESLEKSGIVDAFGTLLETSSGLLEPLGILISSILPAIKPLLEALAGPMALLADTATVLVGILTLDWGTIKRGLGLTGDSAQNRLYYSQMGWEYDASTGTLRDPNVLTYGDYQSAYEKAVKDGYNGTFEAFQNYYNEQYFGGNASGNDNWRGGVTWVGENGPEKIYLPQGTRIQSAQESRVDGGDVFNITISAADVREFNDIVRIAKNRRRAERMGVG